MGLFDDEKEISVASTLYNLAGDEDDRPDFLKSTLFGAVMAESEYLGNEITQSYLHGPGLQLRQFFKYCVDKDYFGLPTAKMVSSVALDLDVIEGEITPPATPAGLITNISSGEISSGGYEPFAQQYIMANMYDRITDDYISSYEPSTGEITIQFDNGDIETFVPVDYSASYDYVVATYYFSLPDSTGDWVVGSVVSVDVLPDLTDWTENSSTPSFTVTPLTRTANVVVSYNNGDPDENSSYDASTTGNLYTSVSEYEATLFVSDNGSKITWSNEKYFFTSTDHVTNDYVDVTVVNEDLGGGVIKTTTTTVTGDQVTTRWDQQHDTREIIEGEIYGHEEKFIYRVGSGNATLDAMVSEASDDDLNQFFPYMPVRLKNKSIAHQDYEEMYDDTVRAYRKATDKHFDEIIESVEDNDDIDDIDYATIVYGISLNVKDNIARTYLQSFFKSQYDQQVGSSMAQFLADMAAYEQALEDLEEYEATNWESTHWAIKPSPPPVPRQPSLPSRSLRLKTNGAGRVDNFDIRTSWSDIAYEEVLGTFTYTDPDTLEIRNSKRKDCMLKNGVGYTYQVRDGYHQVGGDNAEPTVRYRTVSVSAIDIYLQISDGLYSKLTVYGLEHKNVVYDGESVKITANEALNDDDPSGFFIPLHYGTLTDMGIVDYTQISTSCVHILFNSYEVVTTKWYEKTIFKILLVILVIVVAVIAFPGAFAGGGGLLGGNAALGAAAGLTGTAALVAGVVANYLAAMVVSQVLSTLSTNLFGEKWGALFSALLGFALGFAAGGFQFDIRSLLSLTNALANGYAGYMQGEAMEMYGEMAEETEEYNKEMERIQDLMDELMGGNDLNFNPLSLTDSTYGNGRSGSQNSYQPETADQFIQRTMLTGTDVVEIAQSLVYDHTRINLTLPKPQGS